MIISLNLFLGGAASAPSAAPPPSASFSAMIAALAHLSNGSKERSSSQTVTRYKCPSAVLLLRANATVIMVNGTFRLGLH
jgi:hypothetical protein